MKVGIARVCQCANFRAAPCFHKIAGPKIVVIYFDVELFPLTHPSSQLEGLPGAFCRQSRLSEISQVRVSQSKIRVELNGSLEQRDRGRTIGSVQTGVVSL